MNGPRYHDTFGNRLESIARFLLLLIKISFYAFLLYVTVRILLWLVTLI